MSPTFFMVLAFLAEELGLSPELTKLVLSAAPGAVELLSAELAKIDPVAILEATGRASARAWRWWVEHPGEHVGDPDIGGNERAPEGPVVDQPEPSGEGGG
jgi:hypothetical protein